MNLCNILSNITLIFIILLSSFIIYYYFDQTKYKGNITLKSNLTSGPINIHTDSLGFTHIKVKTRKDAFFAIGLVHSRDRLFQLDTSRRLASGKMSELFGKRTLELDKSMREMGFRKTAENDVANLLKNPEHFEINEMMKMYVEGINYWANTHLLPIEYYLLGAKFENWTLEDSFSFYRLMDFSMSGDALFELIHHTLHDYVGKDFYELFYKTVLYDYMYFNETYLSKEFIDDDKNKNNYSSSKNYHQENLDDNIQNLKIPEIMYKVSEIKQSKRSVDIPEIHEGHMSNSWMVHGNYTNTGMPIFSNDPHMHNNIPNTHYLVKLYIEEDNQIITGSTPVCVPFIIIGGNKNLVYGFTTDYRDKGDFVEELLDNDDLDKAENYYIDNKMYKLKVRNETIKIKKGGSINYQIKETVNGPILRNIPKELTILGFDYKYNSENKKISNFLSFNFYNFHKVLRVDFFYKRMFAEKKEDFIPYVKNYYGPPFSLSWATVKGEIGYVPIGHYPIKNNPTQIFSKGYDSNSYNFNETKYIPYENNPILLNPKDGYFSTANSRPLPDNYKYFSTSFELPFRHHRINELLKEKTKNKKYSVDDSLSILSDTHDCLCELLLPKLLKIISKHITKNNYSYRYYLLLKNFNCNMDKSSRGATVYEMLIFKLVQHLLVKNENNGVANGFDNEDDIKQLINNHIFYIVLDKIVSSSIDDINSDKKLKNFANCQYYVKGHNCEEYIIDVFHRLYEYFKMYNLIDKKNDNNDENDLDETVKKWGDVNNHYYTHVLDKVPILKKIFARNINTDGNKNTIKVAKNNLALNPLNPFTSVHSANMKYINDLSDITRPYICLDTGNSGNILSKYYSNMMSDCQKNKLYKFDNYQFTNDPSKELIISPFR